MSKRGSSYHLGPRAVRPVDHREWLEAMSEESWQASLIGPKGHATVRGWNVYHVPDSRKVTSNGYPDLCLVKDAGQLSTATEFHPGRVLFCELKRQGGRVSDAQAAWLDSLTSAGQEVFLFVPSDLDEVIRILESPVRVDSPTEWRHRREGQRT